jgi:CubicO group peptidase (beta-lactamase class C family)
MSVPYAAGGLYSSTHDLLRWEQGLYAGRLLSASSLRQMTTPYMNDYGFGLTIRTLPGGQLLYSHGGGIYGFNGELSYVPHEHLSVIVLANLNGPAPQILSRQLLSLALQDPRIAVPPSRAAAQADALAAAQQDANPEPPSD